MERGEHSRNNNGLRDGGPGFDFRQEQETFTLSITPTTSLGLTQPPIQWILGCFPGVKRLWCEADHSPPSSAELQKGKVIYTPPYVFMACGLVNYEQGQLLLRFYTNFLA
jgi:hypothetical protein